MISGQQHREEQCGIPKMPGTTKFPRNFSIRQSARLDSERDSKKRFQANHSTQINQLILINWKSVNSLNTDNAGDSSSLSRHSCANEW